MKDPVISSLLQRSSQMIKESLEVTTRSQNALTQSAFIIDRSRQLLSHWPVSGTPALRRSDPIKPVRDAGQAPSTGPVGVSAPVAAGSLDRVVEQHFSGEAVRLDGRHFVDCTVENCVLEYSGGPVIMEGTNFSGCRFSFAGEAAMTVSLLECFSLVEPQGNESTASPRPNSDVPRVN